VSYSLWSAPSILPKAIVFPWVVLELSSCCPRGAVDVSSTLSVIQNCHERRKSITVIVRYTHRLSFKSPQSFFVVFVQEYTFALDKESSMERSSRNETDSGDDRKQDPQTLPPAAKLQDDDHDMKLKHQTRILHPSPYDVLLGRGRPLQAHPGNLRFHSICNKHREAYKTARKREKVH
jgi:hypothetical protein